MLPLCVHGCLNLHPTHPLQTHSDVSSMHTRACVPYITHIHMSMFAGGSQPVGHSPFVKPLSPKILTSQFTTVANSH